MIRTAKHKLYNLLRWSERHTKTDMVYLTKGGFWLTIGKVIGILSSFGLAVAFANLLPKDAYGNYRFVLSVFAVVSAFSLTGMNTAVLQAVARGFEGAVQHGARTYIKWSIGVVLISLAVSIYYFLNNNNLLGTSFLIVGAFAPFLESFKLYNTYLQGKKEFYRATLYNIPRQLLPLSMLLGALLVTDSPVILILVYFFGNTVTLGVLYAWTVHRHTPSSDTDPQTVNYSKHLSVMNVISRIGSNIDKILVFHFLGAAPLAVYAFAFAAPKQLHNLGGILNSLAFPKLSQRTPGELQRSLPRKLVPLFVLVLLITLLYILAAPLLFQIVFPQYPEAVIFSQVLALSVLFLPFSILKQTFTAHMKKKQLYVLKTATPFIRIVLTVILLPLLGLWGVVITVLATRAINNIIALYLFIRM